MSETGSAVVPRPPLPFFAVSRPGLVDRLDRALTRPLVVLVAPAGYGKSVLLTQWSDARPGRTVAWVSARRLGGDAVGFGRRLRIGLADAAPALAPLLQRLPATVDRLGSVYLDHLVDALQAGPPVVIVIEDLEQLTSPMVLTELGELAERLPAHVHLILSSRRDPNIGVHRLRLQDQLDEIRQDELVMSEDDARSIVRSLAACELRRDQALALVDRTEGWPAGLQLAALSLRNRDDVEGYLEAFSGDNRHVADYLSDEILAGLDDDEREFLLVTSVLDRLHGPLCDALTGRSDGGQVLESLHRRSLFLTALDDHQRWYRYHALFRDLLHYELRQSRPKEQEVRLHRRAATWLLEAGFPSAAAEHLLAAEAWDEVFELAQREGRAFFERGETATMLTWLERLPRSVIDARPEVALSIVILQLMTGRSLAAERLAEQTELAHDLPPELAALVDLAHATLVYHHGLPSVALAAAERTIEKLEGLDGNEGLFGLMGSGSVRIQAQAAMARAHLLLGEVGEARRAAGAALERNSYPPWLVHATGTAAYCEALAGDLVAAAEWAERSLAVAEEAGLGKHPACADAHLALARVHTQRGDLAAAEEQLEDAFDAARTNRRHLLVGVQRAEWVEWRRASSRTEALAAIAAEPPSGGPPAPEGLRSRLVATEARLYLGAGRGERAAALLAGHDRWTCDLAAAQAAVCAASGDMAGVRKVLDTWPELDATEPWSRLQRACWQVVLDDADGERAAVEAGLDGLLAEAEAQGHLQLFRDGGRELARILRRRYLSRPTPFLRQVVAAVADAPAAGHSDDLVEQLSERELEVLRYLPSRLSNAEIAGRLYVSVNTLKTHLKAIYRKLGVTSRSEAVERAEALDLA
jgi:LuxR family maltose regulon positive regulatory protein